MKKIIKLTESDLSRIVRKVLNEQPTGLNSEPTKEMELNAMDEIRNKIEEFVEFAKAKCMEVYKDQDRCDNFIKVLSGMSMNDIKIDYDNIFGDF